MFQTPKGMSSFLPHYLYALVYWIEENNFDPYLIVNRQAEGVEIPTSVPGNDDGTIALNLASRARDAQHFYFTENHFEYKAAFNGKRTVVKVPYSAIYAVTACGCTEWDGENVNHLLRVEKGEVQTLYAVVDAVRDIPTEVDVTLPSGAHVTLKPPSAEDLMGMERNELLIPIGEAMLTALTSDVPGDKLVGEFQKRLDPDVVQPSQSHESHPDVVENTTSAAEPASNVVYAAFGKRKS